MWGPDIYVCGDVNATVHAHVFVFVYAVIIYLRGLPVLSCCTCRNLLSVFVREGKTALSGLFEDVWRYRAQGFGILLDLLLPVYGV